MGDAEIHHEQSYARLPPTMRGIVSAFRTKDLAAYLGISHQRRVTQMRSEGKLPEPDAVDAVGPSWERATIERWASGSGGGRGGGVDEPDGAREHDDVD
jgi:hypothetical protein